MTEAAELVESIIVVPAKADVTANFTLEPTGQDQHWILKDASGEEVDTIRVRFEGVKNGGIGQSGKAMLKITLVNSDLAFKKLNGNVDGMETYDDDNGGTGAINSCKVDQQNEKILNVVCKANKQTPNGFSFKWVAYGETLGTVVSADPKMEYEPV
ncbi:hypothetical protein [Microbulbifer marinus]|uniref:Uncharacterized protein n=1 Tax=Microbulbifer marinus TaxID=658218 RepID=A0A1H4BBQ4_9GAMM|nr:hypothetical protein [Microbulbifer marinus]SEA45526.1 hypothetical protein SAMN05216562_3185 [Microbulbifer marinus]